MRKEAFSQLLFVKKTNSLTKNSSYYSGYAYFESGISENGA